MIELVWAYRPTKKAIGKNQQLYKKPNKFIIETWFAPSIEKIIFLGDSNGSSNVYNCYLGTNYSMQVC